MKKLAAVALSLFLTSGIAFADTPKDADPQPAKPAKPAAKAAKKKTATEILAEQVEALRLSIEAQQQEIKDLKHQLSERDQQISDVKSAAVAADAKAVEANTKADANASNLADVKSSTASAITTTQTAQTDLVAKVDKVSKDVATDKKETGDRIKALSTLKLSGDLRLRYEPFFGGGFESGPAGAQRNRARFRMRFNAVSKPIDDLTVGFSLASGDLGDPISTNSTETGFFTRKPIAIDKAFATYNPHYFKPFSVTAGKFAYTWYRTELTWDNDLNPEGASEQLAWDWKDKFISHFAIIGFQSPLLEVSGGPDSYMTGGQVQTGWRLGSRVKVTADAAYYDYANADAIAQNQNVSGGLNNGTATSGQTNSGGGTFGFGTATLSNNTGTIGTKKYFASKFGIFDAILRTDFDTGHPRLPIYLLFDYAVNTRACENLSLFEAAHETDPTVVIPTCDPHQKHAYWAEAQFGQTKNKGDFRFGYTFMRIERDAVVSAFNFSDIRNPTNVAQHRLEAFYQAHKNVTFGFTGFIGRQLINAQTPIPDRYLKRFQFDTIFTF